MQMCGSARFWSSRLSCCIVHLSLMSFLWLSNNQWCSQTVQAFTTALDLKPSSADASTIKSAIEKIRASDEDEEEL